MKIHPSDNIYIDSSIPNAGISFSHFGKGKKKLLLFPGWTHPAENEPIFIDKLGKKYNIISVNLPGYVNCPNSPKYNNFTLLAKALHQKLQEEKIKIDAFVGFSMGGRLITTYSKLFPNTIPCVFIGYPTDPYDIPIWAKMIITNPLFLSLFRSNTQFIQFAVNKAYKEINQNPNGIFNSDTVTIHGAFDSLIGLITSRADIAKYIDNGLFIYGEKDSYIQGANNKKIKHLYAIANAEHNCVRDHEDEVVELINQSLTVKTPEV